MRLSQEKRQLQTPTNTKSEFRKVSTLSGVDSQADWAFVALEQNINRTVTIE